MFSFSSEAARTKRRRLVPARKKREVPEPLPSIFENTRVYIHPNNINGSRRKVLHNLIQKHSGVYTLVPDGETTHVLVDEGISSGRLCRSLGWTTFPPNINVLMVSWLSASVRAGRCLNPVDYEIPCTHRPTFATSHFVTSESTAVTGPPDNDGAFSEASSSSVCNEDADAEMPNFEYVYEDGSTYDDGKYDDETSCDDDWLDEIPIAPSHAIGLANPSNPNPSGTFPTNSFSSASNFRSLVSSTSHAKRPKLENTPSVPRPNTLAARLSRVRVRRIPEHLRVPGGRSVIVDLNRERIPTTSGNLDDEINPYSINTVLNGIQTSSTDEQCKKIRMNSKLHAASKTETESSYQNQSTESGTEVSESRSNRFVNAFLPDDNPNVDSDNVVSQVVSMMVESVSEVAVNEKIINESVVEISRNASECEDRVDESLENETIYSELVSDVLFRVLDAVSEKEQESKIEMKHANENCIEISDTLNLEETDEMRNDISMVENEVNESRGNSQMDIEHSKVEPMETSQENESVELVEVELPASEVSVPVSQLSSALTDVSPYPVRLFCSSQFNSSGFGYLSDDQIRPEPVECITAEIGHPPQLESLGSEVTKNSNGATPVNKTSDSEAINQARSCGRPDISGPGIFFPFPMASTSAESPSSPNASTPESVNHLLQNSCHGPNRGIIKKLQVLYESFKNTGDKWRIDVYEKAIIAMAKLTKPVETLEDVLAIHGISNRIAQKIWMISETGHLTEIDEVCSRQSEETRKLYSKAWGITARLARTLYKEGLINLNDLWTKSNLSRSHLVGLRYYDDLKTKMTKKEATRIFLTVLKFIFERYPDVQCDACGSLRRNKNFCSYVSILVTLPRGCVKNDHKVLPDIVAKLHQLGYLIDDLVRHEEDGNQTKYVGIIKLGDSFKHRRIDITVCTREEYACAILFLTGSPYFNRAIQQFALKREMVLDGHSLRIRLLNASGGTDAVTKLHTPDERTIFNFLGLPYRTPEQRDRFIM